MQLLFTGCFLDLTLNIFLWIRACPSCHASLFLCFWIKGHEAPDWTAALDLKNVLFHVYPDADLLLYLKIRFFLSPRSFVRLRQHGPSPSQVTPALAHIQGLMFMKLLSADGLWFICRLPFHLIPWRGHGPLGRFDLEGLVESKVGRRNFGGIGEVFPGASLVAQRVKHLPAMWETPVRSLGQEDPLEKEMATNSIQYSCLENPMDREAW